MPKASEQVRNKAKIWLQACVLKPAPSHLLGETKALIGPDELSHRLGATCRQQAGRQHWCFCDKTPAPSGGRKN